MILVSHDPCRAGESSLRVVAFGFAGAQFEPTFIVMEMLCSQAIVPGSCHFNQACWHPTSCQSGVDKRCRCPQRRHSRDTQSTLARNLGTGQIDTPYHHPYYRKPSGRAPRLRRAVPYDSAPDYYSPHIFRHALLPQFRSLPTHLFFNQTAKPKLEMPIPTSPLVTTCHAPYTPRTPFSSVSIAIVSLPLCRHSSDVACQLSDKALQTRHVAQTSVVPVIHGTPRRYHERGRRIEIFLNELSTENVVPIRIGRTHEFREDVIMR